LIDVSGPAPGEYELGLGDRRCRGVISSGSMTTVELD
jgi:hypothetical protein